MCIGSFFAATSPSSTAGTFASIMPSVVPATTATSELYFAASATVAICVLSPISSRKNAISVVPNTPKRGAASCFSSSSYLSGTSVQAAIAMNDRPRIQRIAVGPTSAEIQAPAAPASAWLTSVATRMPRMMGTGLRNFAASTSASSCVLSPISASATTPVETRNASMGRGSGVGSREP